MLLACVIWGLSPLYYKLLSNVPPLEVLSHRTLWSLMFFWVILLVQRRFMYPFHLLGHWRSLAVVVVASLMISTNWFIYIYAIQVGRTVESSLGYYMFPLVAVLLGLFVFQEKLSRAQWAAVGFAAVAVAVLTGGQGAAPYVSLVLATTFGAYGVMKKWSGAGPVVSVTAEVLVLAPLALLWLWGVHNWDWQGLAGRSGGFFGHSVQASLFLILSGPLTAAPLMLFSYASKRIRLSTLGLVQYLNPSLQFFCAVVLFGEHFTIWYAIAFPLIWFGLAIFSYDSVRQERAARSSRAKSSTVATDLKNV